MTGEVVRTQQPRLLLGDRLSHFMADLDISPTGGRNGSITYLRDQMRQLFSSSIDFYSTREEHDRGSGMKIADDYQLWWRPKTPDEAALWTSSVDLSPKFFAELRDYCVPTPSIFAG
jgi:hypothetical protein